MSTITVDATPDKSLIKKLGMVGYKTEQALAELVDNSIDARVLGAKTTIAINIDYANREITVADDGRGMGLDELRNAWIIAKDRETSNPRLGMFGIGMKSALSALGGAFVISTTTKGSETELVIEYDEKKWLEDNNSGWASIPITQHPADKNKHGTSIRIYKPRVPLYHDQIQKFLARFGTRYGPYIETNEIQIIINDRCCVSTLPDLKEGTRQEIAMHMIDGNIIRGWIGLLKKRSIKGDYGIHLYRKGRLIELNSKFGIPTHPTVAQVIGAIELDHVPVDVFKTKFLRDSEEYKTALARFRSDPSVKEILRRVTSHDHERDDHKRILNLRNTNDVPRVTRLGNRGSRDLLSRISPVVINTNSGQIRMSLEDKSFGIYDVKRHGNTTEIIVNRNSGIFRAFRNPLLFLMMIRLEAESFHKNADMDGLLARRNQMWAEFIPKLIPESLTSSNKTRDRPGPLPRELEEICSNISDNFYHNFQFTAMSTLSNFLRYEYSRFIYTVHTIVGAGNDLKDLLEMHKEYMVLLNPNKTLLCTILNTTKVEKFIIIREYARVPSSNVASLAKSWVDLYFEVTRNGLSLYQHELKMIDNLLQKKLVTTDKILAFARRRKLDKPILKYLEELKQA